ncbi:MAG: hypothetical protein A2X49_08855 [Lentisphaerae bacterium GWF2_52_8]|nr:MAG: hypothetical protein A2X49_08855 [Lentisphaerae bacterium GWF2_52_8]
MSCSKNIVPLEEEVLGKGEWDNLEVPEKLINGTANISDVETWTKAIRQNIPLIQEDMNGDRKVELLAEIVFARGVTGNRSFLFFVHTGSGYKYLEIISNIKRHVSYEKSGESYLLMYTKAGGPEMVIGLCKLTKIKLIPVGKNLTLFLGDSGKEKDKKLWDRLQEDDLQEKELLEIFTKSAYD